jgi:voltage-gated potassium channel
MVRENLPLPPTERLLPTSPKLIGVTIDKGFVSFKVRLTPTKSPQGLKLIIPEISPRLATWRRRTDIPLLLLAIGSLPLLLLEVVANRLPNGDQRFLIAVNVIVFVAFAIDYLVELAVTFNKINYVKSHWASLLIVISQFLALLPALGFLGILRGARALRVLGTISRVIGIGAASKEQGRRFFKEKAASVAFGLSGFTLITSAVAFTIAEDVGDGRRVQSFFDSLWWSASTITTVGYGDIYPVTTAGRIIAVFTMLIGVSTLAVVTARVAQFLIGSNEKQVVQDTD